MENNICKYDIWLVNLEPTKWSEQSWIRPCLIYQSDLISRYTNTFIVLPITSKEKRESSFIVKIANFESFWLDKESIILSFQIRTVDKTRFIKKLWNIKDLETRNWIKQSIMLSLDLEDEFII